MIIDQILVVAGSCSHLIVCLFPCEAFTYTPGKYQCVDMFAGDARVSKAFHEAGYGVCTMDITRDDRDATLLSIQNYCINRSVSFSPRFGKLWEIN